jgi:hypothetical protein
MIDLDKISDTGSSGGRWDVWLDLFRQLESKKFCSTAIKSRDVWLDLVWLIRPTNWVELNIIWTKSTAQIMFEKCYAQLNPVYPNLTT